MILHRARFARRSPTQIPERAAASVAVVIRSRVQGRASSTMSKVWTDPCELVKKRASPNEKVSAWKVWMKILMRKGWLRPRASIRLSTSSSMSSS